MHIRFAFLILLVGGSSLFLNACKDTNSKNHGPIVLGDTSTIVTEKDPKKLMDLVIDLQPDIPPATNPDTDQKDTKATKKDSVKETAAQPIANQPLPDVAGLKAEFKEIAVLIPNITAKLSGNVNLKAANGAVYTLLSGTLDGNVLKIKGSVTKVTQKCLSVVMIKNKLGTLPLENLTGTTDWEAVKAGKNGYTITNIDEESLAYPKVNSSAIRNAVNRAANRRRMNHKKMQEWLTSINNVHSANQKPLTIVLRSVIWKIDGKDEKGKNFSKQIRIDIPI